MYLESGQTWHSLSKMTVFDKNVHFWQKKSNLNAFEAQYLSNVIYYLFLLFETNVLSYLPPFYHNFENLTLYGIYENENGLTRLKFKKKKKKNSFFLFQILIRNFKGAGKKIRAGSVNLVRPNIYTQFTYFLYFIKSLHLSSMFYLHLAISCVCKYA